MRILVIEDEKKVASFIQKGLKEEGYAVDVALDGAEGDYLANINEYDCILLDIMLPKMNGIEVLKNLRKNEIYTPVLMLTAKDTISDITSALDAGGDDYLTKPFAFEELVSRVRALIRRSSKQKSSILKLDDLVVDPVTRSVTRNDQKIELTSKEFALLEYFLRNVGRVLSRTLISEHVWDIHFDSDTNIVDVYVNYLRNKIDKNHPNKLIHTLRGTGYVMKLDKP